MMDDARRRFVERIERAERLLKRTTDAAVIAALKEHLEELRAELAILGWPDKRDD